MQDKDLKNRAFPVIESYGLTPAMAVKLFLKQVANTRTLPLFFNYKANMPNETTLRALEEAMREREKPTAEAYTLEEAVRVMQEIVND